jgi:hypothetical protein
MIRPADMVGDEHVCGQVEIARGRRMLGDLSFLIRQRHVVRFHINSNHKGILEGLGLVADLALRSHLRRPPDLSCSAYWMLILGATHLQNPSFCAPEQPAGAIIRECSRIGAS